MPWSAVQGAVHERHARVRSRCRVIGSAVIFSVLGRPVSFRVAHFFHLHLWGQSPLTRYTPPAHLHLADLAPPPPPAPPGGGARLRSDLGRLNRLKGETRRFF